EPHTHHDAAGHSREGRHANYLDERAQRFVKEPRQPVPYNPVRRPASAEMLPGFPYPLLLGLSAKRVYRLEYQAKHTSKIRLVPSFTRDVRHVPLPQIPNRNFFGFTDRWDGSVRRGCRHEQRKVRAIKCQRLPTQQRYAEMLDK